MKKILIVDVPDDSKIIGCDFWIEQFSESYKKQSHITDYTEFAPPDDEIIMDEARKAANNSQFKSDFPHDFSSVAYGFEQGANWMKGKLI